MTALALARLSVRRNWRSLVPVVVLVAAVSAVVLWSLAAARRTDTAFDRMLATTDAFHVLVNPDNGAWTDLTVDDLLAVDGVSDASRSEALIVFDPEGDSVDDLDAMPGVVFASDGGTGWRLARPIIVDGRMPDVARPDELFVGVEFAELLGVGVGDRLPLRVVTASGGERLYALQGDTEAGLIDPDDLDAALEDWFDDPGFAPVVDFEVTGVGRFPDLVVVDSGYELPTAIATPALFEQLGRPALTFGGFHVRLDDPAAVDGFRDAVDAIVPDESIVYQTMSSVELKAERATSTPGGVLALFGALALALGMLLIVQAVQRWLTGQTRTMTVVRSIGASRALLWSASLVQIAAATLVGLALGAVLAVVGSLFAPVGRARQVETAPGLHVDAAVLAGGLLGAILVVAASSWPAWRAVGRLGSERNERPGGAVARWNERVGLPLPVATGVRFALEPAPGQGGSSRLAIVGSLTGVAVAVAALVFSASIDRLVQTPRLYGTDWSAVVSFRWEEPDPSEAEALIEDALAAVASDPDVRRASVLHAGELRLDGSRTAVVAYRDSTSPVTRTIADGRAPAGRSEIALGAATLDVLGLSIGDVVAVQTPTETVEATVVGRAVLPAVASYSGAEKTAMGEGAIVDPSLLDPLASFSGIAIELAPGAGTEGLEARLNETFPVYRPYVEVYGEPAEVGSLRDLEAFPRWLASALVLLVAIPVVHSLLGSVRGRRRDRAVLSALGARPATLRSIGLAQGLTVVAAGVLVGVPLGVAVGRRAWSTVAESFGTVPEPVVPIVAVSLLTLAVLAVGALIGGAPTWRTNRRAVLRSLRPE